MTFTRLSILAAGMVLAAGCSAGASAGTPTAAAPSPTPAATRSASPKGLSATPPPVGASFHQAHAWLGDPSYGPFKLENADSKPANGFFVAFPVILVAGDQPIDYALSDMYVSYPDGSRYYLSDGHAGEVDLSGHGNAFYGAKVWGQLQPHERASGKVVFDLPHKHGGVLHFHGLGDPF